MEKFIVKFCLYMCWMGCEKVKRIQKEKIHLSNMTIIWSIFVCFVRQVLLIMDSISMTVIVTIATIGMIQWWKLNDPDIDKYFPMLNEIHTLILDLFLVAKNQSVVMDENLIYKDDNFWIVVAVGYSNQIHHHAGIL